MVLDQAFNWVKVTVSTGYDAAATSIILIAGDGSKLPDPAVTNYNLVWWDSTQYLDPQEDPNHEIVRVTGKSTDTITVTRATTGEGTNPATTKNTSGHVYKMILSFTKKSYDDIKTVIDLTSGTNTGDNTIATAEVVTDTASATTWPALYEAATGSIAIHTDAGLTYNASTANLTTTTFTGALTGAASLNVLKAGDVMSGVLTQNGANLAGTAYQSQSFQNLLKNGDFKSWSAGAAADPDDWTIGGGGAAIARESTIVKRGTYSAKITNGLDTIASAQYLAVQTKTGIGINYFKNRTITFGAWVYSATANRARVWIQDDVQPISFSSYHTGDSTWQFLTTTFTVDNTATLINVGINILAGSVINIYGDGAILVEGSVCPVFMPHPTDTIPIVLGAAPTDAGTNGETRWYAVAGAGGARRLYMSNGTDWKYQAIAT